MRERQIEEESDTDNPFRYNAVCRQREGEYDERKDGRMKKDGKKLKVFAGECDGAKHKWGGERERG